MKSITEDYRQQLITDCKKAISDAEIYIASIGNDPDVESVLTRNKIALASLTAEPVGSIMSMTCNAGGLTEARVYMREPGLPDALRDVYTAPPVPVIKLPEKYTDHEDFLTDTEQGYNDAIDEIKHLNGLS